MIGRAALACSGIGEPGAQRCETIEILESAHWDARTVDVGVPLGAIPEVGRPMMVFCVRGRQIATNGVQGLALIRARGPVTVRGETLDRSSILSECATLREVETEVVRLIADLLDDEELSSWAATCAGSVRERHRRLSLLRAEMRVDRGLDDSSERRAAIATAVDRIIGAESRGAWA